MRDNQTRLEDILRAISHIERYATRGRSGFNRDELLQAWIGIQPRIRLTRSFDERSHTYLGYALRLDDINYSRYVDRTLDDLYQK